jgi:hypothetical protein
MNLGCVLGIGGCPTTSSETKALNKTINDTVVNILNQSQQTVNSSTVVTQTLDVSNIDVLSGCTLDITQSSSIKATILQEITQSTASSLVSEITNNIKNALSSNASSETGFLSTGSSSTSSASNVVNELQNLLTSNLTANNINSIIRNVNSNLSANIKDLKYDSCGTALLEKNPSIANTEYGKAISECKIKGLDTKCNISQMSSIDFVAQQITNTAIGVIAQNKSFQDLVNNLDATAKDKKTGLVQDVFGGFSGIINSIGGLANGNGLIVSLACICCICCILIIVGIGGLAVLSKQES